MGSVNMLYDKLLIERPNMEMVNLAKEFANRTIAKGMYDYSDSNQRDVEKIKLDFQTEKISEASVYTALGRLGYSVCNIHKENHPDYTIYDKPYVRLWEKNCIWIDEIRYKIKSQLSGQALRYGLSWTFQDGARRDPILDDKDAWVIFIECDEKYGYECRMYPPYQIKQLKFSDPYKAELKGSKKVVMADDLPVNVEKMNKFNKGQKNLMDY